MSGHSEEQPQSDSGAEDPSALVVPVLVATDHDRTRTVLPSRNIWSQDSPLPKEEGLRIESRIAPVDRTLRTPGTNPIVVTELGKTVVKLETDNPPGPSSRHDSLPVMQPRPKRPTSDANVAAAWGTASAQSNRWLLVAGIAALIAIVAGLAIQPMLAGKKDSKPQGYETLAVVDDVVVPDSTAVYFSEHAGEIEYQMREALTTYAGARKFEDVLPVIRKAGELKETLARDWEPWNVPAGWSPEREIAISYESVGNRPYATLSGTRPDFVPYNVYFIREGGKMVIDWEATTGRGSSTLAGLKSTSEAQPVVRVIVSPASYYTSAFPETKFTSYRLTLPQEPDALVWAYAPKSSIVADTLAGLFPGGGILDIDLSPRSAMLRLVRKSGADGLPNQWLVLDVLHKGWVSP